MAHPHHHNHHHHTDGESSSSSSSMYVYKVPWQVLHQVCTALDLHDSWRLLAEKHMHYPLIDIQEIENECRRSGQSPTRILLERWGQLNHTVLELFVLLARMKHYTGMRALRSVVDQQYHRFIDDQHKNVNKNRYESPDTDPTLTRSLSSQNVPVHVQYVEQGIKIETSDKIQNGPAYESEISNETNASENEAPDKLLAESAGALLMIPYSELATATDHWHSNNVLGKGGFGIVYKGEWKFTAVAIKRLKSPTGKSEGIFAESLRELRYLNACRHDNVLPLYGYSVGGEEPCLVYQLMPGGSLEDNLKCRNGRIPLSWKKRLTIAQGIAKGLQFLHTVSQTPLIHGDIKSANILLDACGEPRIGDFGLAKEGPNADDITHMQVSRVHGTRPYLPDEYLRGRKLSTKVDTYSFGIVLFELVTALSAYSDKRDHRFLKDHIVEHCREKKLLAELQDAHLTDRGELAPDLCEKLVMIGLKCVQTKPSDRPTMVTAWQILMSVTHEPTDYDEYFEKVFLKQL